MVPNLNENFRHSFFNYWVGITADSILLSKRDRERVDPFRLNIFSEIEYLGKEDMQTNIIRGR